MPNLQATMSKRETRTRVERATGWALTDQQLMILVAHRENWALAEIHRRYERLAFSLAFQGTHDPASSEEIVQDVFAKVWRRAGIFDPTRGRFSSWLIAITRHQVIDELRRRHRHTSSLPGEEDRLLEIASDDDPVAAAESALEGLRVRLALRRVPIKQREVIELAFYQGLSNQEIADRCGEPLGTIKTRLRLGKQKLKAALNEETSDQ